MKEINGPIHDLLHRSHGLDIGRYDDSFLNKSLLKRIAETHCGSACEYFALLEQNGNEGGAFLDSLHISYSEFFRNPLTFSVLERIILPSLALKKKNSGRKEIRIWSAACAAGQEAYSLVMLLEELMNGDSDHLTYRIFATDQRASQIDGALEGKFSAEALNNVNLRRIKQWFDKHGEKYIVKPELKKNIDFSVFDLFDEQLICPPESIFGDFDLVICANILFYYKPECRKQIIEKAGDCLANGGYLITGETERDILTGFSYHEVYPQSAIFRKK